MHLYHIQRSTDKNDRSLFIRKHTNTHTSQKWFWGHDDEDISTKNSIYRELDTVVQMWPGKPASHLRVLNTSPSSTSDSSFLLYTAWAAGGRWWLRCEICTEQRLLALAWPNKGCCWHSENELVMFCLFLPFSCTFKNKKIKFHFLQKCTQSKADIINTVWWTL